MYYYKTRSNFAAKLQLRHIIRNTQMGRIDQMIIHVWKNDAVISQRESNSILSHHRLDNVFSPQVQRFSTQWVEKIWMV